MASTYVFWIYNGYVGDSHYLKNLEMSEAIPNSTSKYKYFTWLTQKGFGYGYFNNSGIYKRVFKTKLNDKNISVEQIRELLKTKYSRDVTFLNNIQEYQDEIKRLTNFQKQMNRDHPY